MKRRIFLCFLMAFTLVLPVRAEPIKWVDFGVPYESLKYAMEQDIATFEEEKHIDWINVLSLAACRTGGKCGIASVKKAVQDLKGDRQAKELAGESGKYFDYYHFQKESGSGYTKVSGTDWYYECQFWSEMPDMNLGSELVRTEFEEITSFWLEKGVAGFGFLALAVMIFGQWKPTRIAMAALIFGFFRALSNVFFGFPFLVALNIPGSVYNMLPYIICLIVLAFTSKKSRAPKAEGIPYDKGMR
jgi:hypothetical protein